LFKVLIRSKNFLVVSLGSFRYRIISSANRNTLIFSFPNCVPFFFFLLLNCSGYKFEYYIK
jgi:hypothetical protein